MAEALENQSGHRSRLREKYRKSGASAFHDYELLELLLTYAIQRRDVKPIAKTLFQKFHSFQGVVDAELDELAEVPGLGMNSAILIKLVRDVCVRYLESKTEQSGGRISDSETLFQYAQMRLSGFREEHILAVYLNSAHHVIASEVMDAGVINSVSVNPRKILEHVIEYNALYVVLAHNHPGGNLLPSNCDIETTANIAGALRVINATLLDHLIVSNNGYRSLTEHPELIRRGVFTL